MPDRVLTLHAHGRSYRLYASRGHGSGLAPSKVTRCMQQGVPYERTLLEHIYTLGFTGTAVDAGASVGNHTMWMAAICGLNVVAFEPVVHAELAANVALNDLHEQVAVEPVALGSHSVTTAAHVGKGRLEPGQGDIEVRTLDSYGLADVAVIKADVEGMEPHVLAGGEATIRRDRPVIFAEEWADDPKWHRQIAAVLEPWGYVMRRRFSGRESATPVGKWVHRSKIAPQGRSRRQSPRRRV